MDVFLVPVGVGVYQPYCEVAPDTSGDPAAPPHRSWWVRWWRTRMHAFRQMLAEAEEERARSERGHAPPARGLWRALQRNIAEVVAEQRLLWNLRTKTAATLRYPDDVSRDSAVDILNAEFRRDYARHQRWCIIDTLLFLPCMVLTVIPGPNVPALYFSFRAIAHFLSMRGAAQGLRVVNWDCVPNGALTDIRRALALDPVARIALLDEIAAALGLVHLAPFVMRLSRRSR